MTPERRREILERMYGGDGEVFAPVPDFLPEVPLPDGAFVISEEELASLMAGRLASSRNARTGRVYGCAQGRDAWRRTRQ